MRRLAGVLIAFFLFPVVVQGQVELGIDAGFFVESFDDAFGDADNLTSLSVPVPMLRVGVPVSDMVSVEGLVGLEWISEGDDSFTILMVMPGANVSLGESGVYVRGEAGVLRLSSGGTFDESVTQFAAGAAVGIKQAIRDGPASFRLEAGFDRWFEKEEDGLAASNEFRGLVGLSVLIG